MPDQLKALLIDASSGFYRVLRYPVGDFFGPVDLGLHLAAHHQTLSFGTGLLAGSIFPGTNRLFFTGFSPCWSGFFVSSMGGAGLVFHNLGVDLVSIMGKAALPSVLYLNRIHGEEIEVELAPVVPEQVWPTGRGGVYAMMDHTLERWAERYATDPRVLAVGPAAQATDMGAIASAPLKDGAITHVDTWAGRGGFGSKLLQEHGLTAIVYGGTFVDEDFRDRHVADSWFETRYQKRMAAKALEATTKYRFDPTFETGGTFGVNYAKLAGAMLSFNYQSIHMGEETRTSIHQDLVLKHYLRQFNEETIKAKQQRTCGEPCPAVCKKMHGPYKKDYEPYQTMGPLSGIFDQRAAERLNHHADMLGFDAISVGGVLSWLLECLDAGDLTPAELGVNGKPVFSPEGFAVETDSAHNADLGVQLLDSIVEQRGLVDLRSGARRFARRLARDRGQPLLDRLVYTAFGRRGWMVPNQYWTPGVLSPMAMMGKYYMYYGSDFVPPRELGRRNAERMKAEIMLDTLGMCRFHRGWAEEMAPEIMGELFNQRDRFLEVVSLTASRINSRNASVFWEPARNGEFVHSFLHRRRHVLGDNDATLQTWLNEFDRSPHEAGLSFWYELHKGTQETLREFGY